MRSIAEKRHNDWKKAIRKREIDRNTQGTWEHRDWYDNLHQYSKNKIRCSCGICKRFGKTNNKGHRRNISKNYAPSKNWAPPDRRRIDEMIEQNQEFDSESNL